MSQVIVVGGGLSGNSAAHTALEHGARVLLLDKKPFCGGNSVKATSGINGALTVTQVAHGIKDSAQAFEYDTALSATKGEHANPTDLCTVLTHESGPGIDWLIKKFGLDLSLLAQLGGHSFPRTHRGKEKFPGMTITYALIERLEEIAKAEPEKARVINNATVTELIHENGKVIGVKYTKDGKTFSEYGPVVLASGGYAADYTDNSLLKKYRPDLLALPTTNGDHCTGDGIKMSMAVNAGLVDMDFVQVHPTGLVDPKEPDAKVKFLAAEALRGCGGIMVDKHGKRFCDELGRRDYVSGEMFAHEGPFRLILNGKASKSIEWHCKHYCARGVMKHFNTGAEVAAEIGCSPETLAETFAEYNKVGQSPPDQFGKKFFHNLPLDINDNFHVAIVTPVVHYTMGGLVIGPDGNVLKEDGSKVEGLYAGGEIAGGIHGKNRLGGNSLLDCVVFGRVSGATAARYLFGELTKNAMTGGTTVKKSGSGIATTISHAGMTTSVDVDPKTNQVSMNITWDDKVAGASVTTSDAAAPAVEAAPAEAAAEEPAPGGHPKAGQSFPKKEYSWDEVKEHTAEDDVWVVVRGEVLDVTNFLTDHPGGKKAIMAYAGEDATEQFDMFHKPDVIDKYAPYVVIGNLAGGAKL